MSFAKPKQVEYFRITKEIWDKRDSWEVLSLLPDWIPCFTEEKYKWYAYYQRNSKSIGPGSVLIKVCKDSCYAMPGWKFDMLFIDVNNNTIED